jgi:sugar/nucleoside kinase (ribokinase family)
MVRVGCAGILVADMLCGPVQALPRPGELLAVDDIPAKAGGCAANVAIDLSRQRIAASVAGCVGRDAAAETPLAVLRAHGVDCAGIVQSDRLPTSKTVVLLVAGQDRRFLHAFGANAEFNIGHIRREWLSGLSVFYLGGLFVMPGVKIDELVDLLAFCHRSGIVTVVTVVVPKPFDQHRDLATLLPMIDYFLPNDDEARVFTGKRDPVDQAAALAAAGARTPIVTCGARGAVAARGRQRWRCGAYDMPIVDPSGCGDAFAAGVITGIVRGWDMARTLVYASALGASAVRAVGTTDGVFRAGEAEAFVAGRELPLEEWTVAD